jgi:pyruvate/2-oxoacid:ferredoxin oxidoreductase beta subunit
VNNISHPTYIDEESLPYPFCPGCGHGVILTHLNTALVQLQLDPRKLVIVTDIGCAGLSDKFFETNAFHGLHGRSVTYATGIKLANPDLKVIVLIGDGGCGIGGNHLIHAARRNIDVTVLVFNNLNYGMTGGEHSVTTPQGSNTVTTRYGHLEHPMDICATVTVNGASFVARSTSFEKNLPDLITQAIRNEGFSLIDIWELCTAYYVPNNRFSKKALESSLEDLGFAQGILHQEKRPEYASAYRQAVADQHGLISLPPYPLPTKYAHNINTRINCIIAGSAGQRIGTSAGIFCRAAVLSGLWAYQQNDYPVTVRSGYSLSEVTLSHEEIGYSSLKKPDLMVVVSEEGLEKVASHISQLSNQDTLFINADLLPLQVNANIVALDLKGKDKKYNWGLIALEEVVRYSNIFPIVAWEEAISMQKDLTGENLT